ncbi:hypothetical protein COI93_02240 [Bacillus cereus]|uniref:Uncharacterized protein n=1 Tax=Bacillus cereus TaxID=1396 RepID=A0A2B0MZY3_BACCE|nr:hypothetical protein COI93_02240 [Bacillus cereus]
MRLRKICAIIALTFIFFLQTMPFMAWKVSASVGSLNPGSLNPGGLNAGSLDPGSLNPGGLNAGSLDPGGLNPGSLNGGSLNPGGLNPGSLNGGSLNPGGLNPGSLNGGSLNPGGLNPGSLNGGSLNPGGLNSGSLNGGSLNSGGLNPGSLNGGSLNPGGLNSGSLNGGNISSGGLNSGSLNGGNLNPGSLNPGSIHVDPNVNPGTISDPGTIANPGSTKGGNSKSGEMTDNEIDAISCLQPTITCKQIQDSISMAKTGIDVGKHQISYSSDKNKNIFSNLTGMDEGTFDRNGQIRKGIAKSILDVGRTTGKLRGMDAIEFGSDGYDIYNNYKSVQGAKAEGAEYNSIISKLNEAKGEHATKLGDLDSEKNILSDLQNKVSQEKAKKAQLMKELQQKYNNARAAGNSAEASKILGDMSSLERKYSREIAVLEGKVANSGTKVANLTHELGKLEEIIKAGSKVKWLAHFNVGTSVVSGGLSAVDAYAKFNQASEIYKKDGASDAFRSTMGDGVSSVGETIFAAGEVALLVNPAVGAGIMIAGAGIFAAGALYKWLAKKGYDKKIYEGTKNFFKKMGDGFKKLTGLFG